MNKKSALISGATRGIGLAIARKLAVLGYDVATFSRTQSELDSFPGKMEGYGAKALTFLGSASDDDFLGSVVKETINKFGGLDVLINNAGGGKRDTILDANVMDWDCILNVNLRATMLLTKLCLSELTKKSGSTIINIASIAGKMGFEGESAYCAAKFGVVGFTQCLFEEIRDSGTKVCTICPGYVDTALIPHRKALMREEMIRPEDIAHAVEFVLSSSPSACPVEITIRPQRNPFKK